MRRHRKQESWIREETRVENIIVQKTLGLGWPSSETKVPTTGGPPGYAERRD